MIQKLVMIGNAITTEILHRYIRDDARYEVCCFSVDREYIKETTMLGLDVVPLEELGERYPAGEYKAVIAMGYSDVNRNRAAKFDALKAMGYDILTYVHPDAKIYNDHAIGEGSLILPNSVVEPFAVIGKNSFVWANCTVAHHSRVGDHCWIASGSVVSGDAQIGSFTFLGVNTTVVNQVRVGELNVIGANAMISGHTKDNEVHLARSAEKHRFAATDYAKFYLN